MSCPFSNQSVHFPDLLHGVYAKCPMCGAIRRADWRVRGYVYDYHDPPTRGPHPKKQWWELIDGKWTLQTTKIEGKIP